MIANSSATRMVSASSVSLERLGITRSYICSM